LETDKQFMAEKFQTINEQRQNARKLTLDHEAKLDRMGYDRYRQDKKQVEEYIEKVQRKELERARDSYLKLQQSMELSERKQKDYVENFNREAEEAKKRLMTIERDIKTKQDQHSRTLAKLKEKCHN